MIFFYPSDAFVSWLVEYAGDRLIIDAGCGEGLLTRKILDAGHENVLAIDPRWPDVAMIYQSEIDGSDEIKLPSNHVVSLEAQHFANHRHPLLMVCARPSHGGWVSELVDLKADHIEVLYIGKPSNISRDFDELDHVLVELPAPACKDERVYRAERSQVTV